VHSDGNAVTPVVTVRTVLTVRTFRLINVGGLIASMCEVLALSTDVSSLDLSGTNVQRMLRFAFNLRHLSLTKGNLASGLLTV
jgi:hypothetical protein